MSATSVAMGLAFILLGVGLAAFGNSPISKVSGVGFVVVGIAWLVKAARGH